VEEWEMVEEKAYAKAEAQAQEDARQVQVDWPWPRGAVNSVRKSSAWIKTT